MEENSFSILLNTEYGQRRGLVYTTADAFLTCQRLHDGFLRTPAFVPCFKRVLRVRPSIEEKGNISGLVGPFSLFPPSAYVDYFSTTSIQTLGSSRLLSFGTNVGVNLDYLYKLVITQRQFGIEARITETFRRDSKAVKRSYHNQSLILFTGS